MNTIIAYGLFGRIAYIAFISNLFLIRAIMVYSLKFPFKYTAFKIN